MLARAAYWLEKAGLFFAPQRQLYQKNVLRPVGCAGRASRLIGQAIVITSKKAACQALAWRLLNSEQDP
jgi:hypothetical protein